MTLLKLRNLRGYYCNSIMKMNQKQYIDQAVFGLNG